MGLAVGDALGTTLELSPSGSFAPIADMVRGGPFQLRPGEGTNDPAMALCLAAGLIERRGFGPVDQPKRDCCWYRTGHPSSTGRCFAIGNTTRAAFERFERTREPCCGSTDPATAGNGSIMRLAPIPLFFARDPREAIARAADSPRTTRGAPEAVDACRHLAALLVGALADTPKEVLLADAFTPAPGLWAEVPLAPRIAEVSVGSFWRRDPPEIRGSGEVVGSLEAALWAFHRSSSSREGALLAVNRGEDADTTEAAFGKLADTYCGGQGIPRAWRTRIDHAELIRQFADRLHALPSGVQH